MGTVALTQWVITFYVTPVSCTAGVLSCKPSLYRDISHKWKPAAIQSQPAPPTPHLRSHHTSVYTAGRQQDRQDPGTVWALTNSFIQPQNCSGVIYSCSLAQQDLCLKSAGLWLEQTEYRIHGAFRWWAGLLSERKWGGGKSVQTSDIHVVWGPWGA